MMGAGGQERQCWKMQRGNCDARRDHTELPTLLGRVRLQLGGRKGQCGENSRNSAERVKKPHCHEKLEFPRAAEPGRAPSKVLTGDSVKLRLSQMLGRPWHKLGANPPPARQHRLQSHVCGGT